MDLRSIMRLNHSIVGCRGVLATFLFIHLLGACANTNPVVPPANAGTAATQAVEPSMADRNKALVKATFERWREGKGTPFDLMEPDTSWTIVGTSPMSRKYSTREEFLNQVVKPLDARLSVRLTPLVRGLYADGDMVIVFFDASATAKDDKPYRNTYTWYFQMRGGRVIDVIAFFDTKQFDELWTRVSAD